MVIAFAGIAAAQVRERATEEILPGVRARSRGDVVMDVGQRGCKPPCGDEQVCRYDCRQATCETGAPPEARCSLCEWRCVE